jgi:hypothetical protein
LAQDAVVELVYTLVRQCLKALIPLVICFVSLSAQTLKLSCVSYDRYRALVDDSFKVALELSIEDLAEMLDTESRVICTLTNADADHVSLTSMHHALNAVEVLVDFALKYWLKVSLHSLAGNVYHDAERHGIACAEFIEIRAIDINLVIFDLVDFFHTCPLECIYTSTVDVDPQISLADDLTLKCGRERNRDVNLGDLDFDVAGLK